MKHRVPPPAVAAIRVKLLKRGDTIASWARRRGHNPRQASLMIYRWASREGRPVGPMTVAILRDISLDLGIAIPPNINWAARASEDDSTTTTATGEDHG